MVQPARSQDEEKKRGTYGAVIRDSVSEELARATQVKGPVQPIVREKPAAELVKVTDEMKSFNAYSKLRAERTNKRHSGARIKRVAEAEKEDKK